MRGRLLLVLVSCFGLSMHALAQTQPAPPVAIHSGTVPAKQAVKKTELSKPTWSELSASDQAALRPLAANWDGMGEGQKRKWLTVAKDFSKLAPDQQAKMQTRMKEWTALSPQQRNNARLNFAQHRELTDGLTPEQRRVQWEAYQQLSPEAKRKLAESAPKAALPGAAPAIRPQAILRKEAAPEFGTGKVLAKAKSAPVAPQAGKKIAVAPHVVEQGSVLPSSPAPNANQQ